jgi:hypothetical protein
MSMTASAAMPRRFGPGAVADLDEPVRRYLAHALVDGGELHDEVELAMAGRIKVGPGPWLAFSATQRFSGNAFEWRARAGFGRFRPLHVVDRYADGAGAMDGRVFGRWRFLHADGEDTARAAAARGAAESMWVPASLLPERGVRWRAVSDAHIVATVAVAPERPDVHFRIDMDGALRSVWLMRWGKAGTAEYGYIPFGGEILAERRFGDVVIPSRVTVGWWFGTPRYAPFFEATLLEARPIG